MAKYKPEDILFHVGEFTGCDDEDEFGEELYASETLVAMTPKRYFKENGHLADFQIDYQTEGIPSEFEETAGSIFSTQLSPEEANKRLLEAGFQQDKAFSERATRALRAIQ